MMLGRAPAMAVVNGALARLGEVPVLVVAGEPGIGKSRLLDELAARATGARVLRGRAAEFAGDRPYGVVMEAMGSNLELPVGERYVVNQAVRERLEALAPVVSGVSTCVMSPHTILLLFAGRPFRAAAASVKKVWVLSRSSPG